MASLFNNKPNHWAVQFTTADGRRRPVIYLGRVGRKAGDAIRSHVEHLLNATIHRQAVPRDTALWLAEIGDDLHAKLARAGLVAPREEKPVTEIGGYFDAYIARRTDLRKMTVNNFKQVRRYIVKHFGEGRDMKTITRGEMGDWHRFVKAELSQATAAMHVKKARQVFADALDRRLIDENPVKGIKAGSMENRERFVYVTAETIERVIAKCPDAEWRLVFALGRYAGLRVPSETTGLRWEDVDWERGRMVVRSPKTERHGKASREVPIFPELLPHLRDAFDAAPEGAKHVIARHRGENLRTTAFKIIKRAGLEPWGKLFQNLRSSCETDLTARFPLHVACAWVGNTEAVARKHYLQVTDQHFEQAIGGGAAKSAAEGAGNDRKGDAPESDKPGSDNALGDSECPRWGPNSHRIAAEMLGVTPRALQKALRRLEIASPYIQQAELNRLRRLLPAPAPRKAVGK